MTRRLTYVAALVCAGLPVAAADLALPIGARLNAEAETPATTLEIPTGPYSDGVVPHSVASGRLDHQAWVLRGARLTALQLLEPLRAQLIEAGYEPVYECQDIACGGFDFRFALDLLPEPAMHVDLGDYRFLSARLAGTDGGDPSYALITVSRSGETGFVHISRIGPADEPLPEVVASSQSPGLIAPTIEPGELAKQLESLGRASLDDLTFDVGSAQLGSGEFASLAELAGYLKANSDKTVALVGHTDSVGSLDANIGLSRRRASSVRDRLISQYGVAAGQLEADGVGYLSPRASNLTKDGRDKNRRVEVILTSTQ